MGTGAQTPGAGGMIPPGGIATMLPGMSPGMGGSFPGMMPPNGFGMNPAMMPQGMYGSGMPTQSGLFQQMAQQMAAAPAPQTPPQQAMLGGPATMGPGQAIFGNPMARPLPVPPNQPPMQMPTQGKRMMPRGPGNRGMGM